MRNLIILLLLSLTSGCTHYLYQGDFTATDNLDNTRQYRLWWTRTDPLMGAEKAGPMILEVTCGTPVTLTESKSGISFIAGSDAYRSTRGETGVTLTCAKITNLSRFLEYRRDDIRLESMCEPKADDEGFSVVTRTFLSTRQGGYRIPISETEAWSFLDSALEPAVLGCPEVN